MSSIYLYIIYISRPWFKGSGAALHGGRSENGGRWQAADPYQTSILLCPFCRYAIVHTNHHFARKRESTAMAILLTFFFNWWKNGCVPKDFNQKHAGCRETSGVFCCERGSGLWWRLRRMLDDGILVSSAFPNGEGAPKGRIGHWRYERERGEKRLKSTIYESTLSTAPRRFL